MTDENTAITDEQEAQEYLADLAALNTNRSATYGMLSRLFHREIDKETLQVMHGMRFPAATGNAKMDQGHRMMAKYLSNVWDNSVTELAIDYYKTFIGNSNDFSGAAFPFESFYTSEKHLLMQEARDEVLGIYRAYGMEKDESWKEGEDHIAVELEFIKIMAARTAEALEAGDEDEAIGLLKAQSGFMDAHLSAWVPMLTTDMDHFAATGFYKALALMTEGYLELDADFLTTILSDED